MIDSSKYPLVDLSAYHDACGTGFIAEVSAKPSRRVVTLAISALKRLAHRGATGADKKTGDGAGILTDIPQNFFTRIVKQDFGRSLVEDEALAVAMVFAARTEVVLVEKMFQSLAAEYDMGYIGKREVPTNGDALGETAKSSCPVILQFFLACPEEGARSVEARLYLLHKAIEKELTKKRANSFICSLSSKTVVYKGLMTSSQIDHFYLDLIQPDYVAKVALFHERFSTNTISTWAMAQPFRFTAHNGEINTIKGNRLWMQAREGEMTSAYWGNDLETLKPIIAHEGSDSCSLDNTLEFLCRSGRSLFHNLMMLIPEPYQNSPNMSRALKDFYIYHENLMEPWDGPAALVFTDGDYVGAKLDRNGLRPLRYTLTKDGLVIMASEAGVVDVETDNLILHHHMTSGEIFAVALDGSGILEDAQIKRQVSEAAPYSSLLENNFKVIGRKEDEAEFGEFALPQDGFDQRLRFALGWNKENLSRFLIPMAETGREPIGSMGDDTPPALLSKHDRRFYDYFKQSFAQVTNPPIDPIRERFVMSLFKYMGSEENLLAKQPRFNGAIRIKSPVLSPRETRILMENISWFPHTRILCHLPLDGDFEDYLEKMKNTSEEAVFSGSKIIFLSDEHIRRDLLPIPMALMVSTIHHHLIEKKIRSKVSIICLTGDVVEDHHVACLIGFGASAVYPYMAYELIREHFASADWPKMMSNYRYALEKGLLKIMSKMGISTTSSYHGSMLFHGIGLSQRFLDSYFPSIKCETGGIGLPQIREWLVERNSVAFADDDPRLKEKGFFRYRKGGEEHGFAPAHFKLIHKLAAGDRTNGTNGTVAREPVYLRDLLETVKGEAVPLEQVEEVSEVCKRFGASAISFGAISDEAHRTLAKGMHLIGGRSNTGEGGEAPDRYAHGSPDRNANCYVKQVASGRFGVTIDYLRAGKELQIKMAQGSKPGEGGQLPGHKVTVQIASARSSTPGVPLISPPPHHDIYSIEDIAQLIYDLKQANPQCKVSVKLVSQPGVGIVASGVVKAGADVVLISGGDGGTGASPLGSMKNTGLPWELGLAETHQTLMANGLRSRTILRVDGGLKKGRDVIMAALLGAGEFDFGTSALVAIGCVMARQCHLNTCPAGIATQDEKLREKFKGKPEKLANYLMSVAEEVRSLLSEMGFYSLEDIVGRTDFLTEKPQFESYIAEKGIDLTAIMNPGAPGGLPVDTGVKLKLDAVRQRPHIDEEIMEEIRPAIMTHGHVVVRRTIRNTDRSIGTRLSGELAFLYGEGHYHGNIQYQLRGAAGQSFGAFLTAGIELRLRGVANDYVGKGMSGGIISIRMPKRIRARKKSHTVIGNVVLYGATGGKLLVAGRGGERFAVRNSGAAAVVEGVGNHCCEYMTRGTVIVLGEFGRNFGAGMTGGVAFVYRASAEKLENLNRDFVRTASFSMADEGLVRRLLRSHKFHTGSVTADLILNNWEDKRSHFVKVVPLALDIIDFEEVYDQHIAARMGVLLNE